MRRDACLARAEDRVRPVNAYPRGTAGPWLLLVAGDARIPETRAARALQQVAADGGHVAYLRGSACQKRFHEHRIGDRNSTVGRHVSHACEGADLKSTRGDLNAPMGQAIDVHERCRSFDVFTHEIHERGATGQEARTAGSRFDRAFVVLCTMKLTWDHVSTLPRHTADGGDDAGVSAAAADVAAHPRARLFGRAGVPFRDVGYAGEDLARRAVAALKRIVLDEGGLQRMQAVALRQALNRGDRRAVARGRQCETGQHTPAIDQNGTRAAGAVVTALLGAVQMESLAQ